MTSVKPPISSIISRMTCTDCACASGLRAFTFRFTGLPSAGPPLSVCTCTSIPAMSATLLRISTPRSAAVRRVFQGVNSNCNVPMVSSSPWPALIIERAYMLAISSYPNRRSSTARTKASRSKIEKLSRARTCTCMKSDSVDGKNVTPLPKVPYIPKPPNSKAKASNSVVAGRRMARCNSLT